jgi:ketosteroid isomerase-like protein
MMDAIEVHAPGLAALAVRLLLRMPAGVRRRVLADAFDRAERAFNRADLEPVLALFADDVEYVPPPALHTGPPIVSRAAVRKFWRDIFKYYTKNRIVNLSIEETDPARFVRTARLSHEGPSGTLDYVIRQTTDIRRGRVIRQVNEQL